MLYNIAIYSYRLDVAIATIFSELVLKLLCGVRAAFGSIKT